jgi:acyl-CoA reductase-like NAD-dependent aldehyde dehydrogenase
MATTTEPVRKLLVGGDWYETGETLDVNSPFDGSLVAQVAYGGADDARRAIDAAAEAMRNPVPAHERAAVLDRLAVIARDRRDAFAETIAPPGPRRRGPCRRSCSRPSRPARSAVR